MTTPVSHRTKRSAARWLAVAGVATSLMIPLSARAHGGNNDALEVLVSAGVAYAVIDAAGGFDKDRRDRRHDGRSHDRHDHRYRDHDRDRRHWAKYQQRRHDAYHGHKHRHDRHCADRHAYRKGGDSRRVPFRAYH